MHALAQRLRRAARRAARSVSAIWSPTVKTGFSDVIGSWKITEMSLPRMRRIAGRSARARSRPSKRIAPRTTALSGSRRRIAIAVTLLPLPDSPTSATVRFGGTSKLDALDRVEDAGCGRRGSRRADRRPTAAASVNARHRQPELRVERVAQAVGEQRERGHEHGHAGAGGEQLPPLADDEFVLRLGQHRAPRHDVDRHAEAEERQDHLGLDERDRRAATAARG